MEFQARKLAAMEALASPEPDKSRKGGVDEPIVPLITRINAHPAFFTTSSCSGRISISNAPSLVLQEDASIVENTLNRAKNKQVENFCYLIQEPQAEEESREPKQQDKEKEKRKKKGGEWSYVSHSRADAEEVIRAVLQTCVRAKEEEVSSHGIMVFRFEPFILAVECVDLDAAQALVSCAISSGFRESGITSVRRRIIAAVRCSIRIEAPIAEQGRLLITEDYLNFLVRIANEKMLNNRHRTNKFLSSFIDQVECALHNKVLVPASQVCQRQMTKFDKNVEVHQRYYQIKSKAKGYERNRRKFLELERRQVGLLSRLDEVEAQLCGIVPGHSGADDNSFCVARGVSREKSHKDLGFEDREIIDDMLQLKVPIKDNTVRPKIDCVSAQVHDQTVLQSLHPMCEKGLDVCFLVV